MSTTRIAGIFYVLTFIGGIYAFFGHGPYTEAAGAVGGACYVVVTVLLYRLFKPVHAPLSLLAAAVSIAGVVAGPLHLTTVSEMVFFGVYCVLIGYLSLRSTFVPRVVGILMMCAGLGWLTFLSPRLSHALSPYILAPGFIGEGALTVWLLVTRVDVAQPSPQLLDNGVTVQ
jgi:hypothetical protein